MRAPCGAWRSPLGAERVAEGAVRLAELRASGSDLYWLEGRPAEQGRSVVVQRRASGALEDRLPPPWSARTLVHEYGGGAYAVHGETIWFANFADQRLYRQEAGGVPIPITPEPERPRALRHADLEIAPGAACIYCVRERHLAEGEVHNELVVLPTDGSAEPRVIASGQDFYSFPRLAPDGERLAWTSWNHPRMPWDGTELWLATVTSDGGLGEPRRITGGDEDSIFQPEWSPEGVLHFVSDRSGFWNLYRWQAGEAHPIAPMRAEFGLPQWGFALASYGFLADGRIVCAFSSGGLDRLGVIGDARGVGEIETPWDSFGRVVPFRGAGPSQVAAIAASAHEAPTIVRVDASSGASERLHASRKTPLHEEWLSAAEAVEFPTAGGKKAHALFYEPRNPECEAAPSELPPLIVISHGGPTAATSSALNLFVQYFTTRGFAVVDVNYGGSTGYGRAYRERLRGQWGVVDTEDCVRAAEFLAAEGRVDAARMAIRGGSAGGFTTLCALAFRDVFAAGVSYFGVADLEALARDTHKFESRYLDSLIGPDPETRDLYRERSPVHHAHRISCPMLILQGLEDAVVPPSQSEVMVRALEGRGIPHAYLAFPGEQHGFRRAENIARALEAELSFYGQVFRFTPADSLEPLELRHSESLGSDRA